MPPAVAEAAPHDVGDIPPDETDIAFHADRHPDPGVLAHVAGPEVADIDPDEYRSLAERRLEKSRRSLEEAGVEARTLFMEGDPASRIVTAAGDEEATLVVMGSTGKSVSVEQLVGSINERVALTSDVSVLDSRRIRQKGEGVCRDGGW